MSHSSAGSILAVGGAEDNVRKRDILERFVREAGGSRGLEGSTQERPFSLSGIVLHVLTRGGRFDVFSRRALPAPESPR